MKVRIKFSKYGVMRFIGHLDMMRYFQKSMRRAGIDICYSTGFSPHQIMSFAAPLGVGVISTGEYFDVELNSAVSSQDVLMRLNQVMVPGVTILSVKQLPDTAKNAMSSVAAAKYKITWKEQSQIPDRISERFIQFYKQSVISVIKKTKKNTIETDIKPGIYQYSCSDNQVELFLDASSGGNIKPLAVMEAFYQYMDKPFDKMQFMVERIDTFYNRGSLSEPDFAPLDAAGEEF